jgi:hypothetical protein
MAASYPTSVKDFGSDVVNSTSVIEASHINDIRDEVEAIETELGSDPSGSESTVKDRIAALESADLQFDVKASCRVATIGNGDLATDFATGESIDEVTLSTGDRILIKNQTLGATNGIYTVNASGEPTRATDFDSDADVTAGAYMWVTEGDVNDNTAWVLGTNDPINLGTTLLVFNQWSGDYPYNWTAAGDGGSRIVSDGEVFTFAGGAGIGSTVSGLEVTHAIDSTVTTLTGSQTLTNKTLTSPVLNTGTVGTSLTLLEDATMIFEGATDNAYETTLTVTDPTADRTVTIPNATDTLVGKATTDTLTNKTLTSATLTSPVLNTGVSGSAVKDQDDMSSDSATHVSTQQSIKAYVDTTVAAAVTAEDLDFQGDSGGALNIDLDSEVLDIAGGAGIDTSGSSNTLTVAIDSSVTTLTGSQTLTNKVLTSPDVNTPDIDGGTVDAITSLTVAANVDVGTFEVRALKFESDQATGTPPLVVASTTVVPNLNADKIDGADLDTGTSLGSSDEKVPSQNAVKAYVDAQVTAQDLDFQGDSGGALSIDLDSETLDIAGGAGVDTSGSDNTLTVAIDSTVTTLAGSQTLTNKTLTSPVFNTGVSGSAVLDSDTMSGASATTVASTESIVAYVAAQIATEDTIAELNDTDVSAEASGNILIYDGDTWDNDAVSGDATLATGGAITIAADAVTYAKMQDVTTTNRLLGRDSAGAGVIEEITPANTRTMLNVADGADVTDATSVTAAGALMDSEVDADIKTLVLPASTTISTYGASLVDDAAASNARTTLGLGALATLDSVAAGQIDADSVDSSELVDGSIDESHLSATNSATDNDLLSYDNSSSGFTWVAPAAGGVSEGDAIAFAIALG